MSTSDEASIPPQIAFDRLSRLRLNRHSMHSALQAEADLTKATVPGAAEVSITLITEGRADTAVTTGQLAVDLDESQYEPGYGPCLDAARQEELMHIEDMTTETRWADYTIAAANQGALSSLSIPISLQQTPALSAALNIYSTHRHAFDDASIRTATTRASYAETTLTNMHEHDSARHLVKQLAAALETRPMIARPSLHRRR